MGIDRVIHRSFRLRPRPIDINSSYPIVVPRGGRARLIEVFRDLGYKTGVEVGVRRGSFSRYMCETIPDLKLYCVDPWAGYSEVPQQPKHDSNYTIALEQLKGFNTEIMKMKSLEAVHKFDDRSLDFVYIDGDHTFDSVMADLICWSHKVKNGGILSGDDYFFYPDVMKAVNTFVDCHNYIGMWYVLREIVNGHTGGSFFWVVNR